MLLDLTLYIRLFNMVKVQGRSQKSGEGGAAVLFDIARIRKGVLEPIICA